MSSDQQPTDKSAGSLSTVPPPGSPSAPSPPPAVSVTFAVALVNVMALVPVSLAVQSTLTAWHQGNQRAGYTLLGLGLVTLGVAAPTSFREVWAVAKRFLPGGRP